MVESFLRMTQLLEKIFGLFVNFLSIFLCIKWFEKLINDPHRVSAARYFEQIIVFFVRIGLKNTQKSKKQKKTHCLTN